MSDPRDDHALLQAWSEGDRAAGEALVARHVATVHRFFHNKVPGSVPELSQRTFLACLEAHARFEARSSFRTWLLGIAHHQLLRYLRDQQRDASKQLDIQQHSIDALLQRAPTSPTQRVVRHHEHQTLLAALRTLPLAMQMLLELRYWEGLSVPEVAQVLEVPAGTVASRLHRARGRLRALLESDVGADRAETTLRGLAGWAQDVAAQVSRKK